MKRPFVLIVGAAAALLVAAVGASAHSGFPVNFVGVSHSQFGTEASGARLESPEPTDSPEPSPTAEPTEQPEPSPTAEPTETPEATDAAEGPDTQDEDQDQDQDQDGDADTGGSSGSNQQDGELSGSGD